MWSRVVEAMLGCWLLISPLIFREYLAEGPPAWHDLACGALVILGGLLSYWPPLGLSHLASLLVGGWLVAAAYLYGFGDPTPTAQNHLILGLLLVMFGVIPNAAAQPPSSWSQSSAQQTD